ncbi:hypothetical protein LB506_000505 [Fusarium annulatum]|nr:hypothetical protein LB506_000505 [Fusarium annulatum]
MESQTHYYIPPPSSFAFRRESGRRIRHIDISSIAVPPLFFRVELQKLKHLAVALIGSSFSSLLNKVNAVVGVNLLNLIWIGIAADGLDRSAAVIVLGIIRASVQFAVSRGPRHVRFMPRGFISLL